MLRLRNPPPACVQLPRLRGGFTVLELLTVIGVISLLLALLLPAVQRARETARKTSCAGNLRELGRACESVLTTFHRYPDYKHVRGEGSISGHVELLPHLGEAELFNKIDPNEEGSVIAEPVQSTHNRQFENHWIGVFHCPSDFGPSGGNNYRACAGSTPHHLRSSKPPYEHPEREALLGIFSTKNKARPQDIVDGLSQTVLYSERVMGDGNRQQYAPFRDTAVLPRFDDEYPDDVAAMCQRTPASPAHFSSSGHTWLFGMYAHTKYNHVLTPNSRTPDCVGAAVVWRDLLTGAHSARSFHSGGVNVCMADGAVRFVSDGIDLKVWRAIASIEGGELVSEF